MSSLGSKLAPDGTKVDTSINLIHVDDRHVFVHWTPRFENSMHRIIRLSGGEFEVHCNHLQYDESVICAQIKKMIHDEKDD